MSLDSRPDKIIPNRFETSSWSASSSLYSVVIKNSRSPPLAPPPREWQRLPQSLALSVSVSSMSARPIRLSIHKHPVSVAVTVSVPVPVPVLVHKRSRRNCIWKVKACKYLPSGQIIHIIGIHICIYGSYILCMCVCWCVCTGVRVCPLCWPTGVHWVI